MTTDGQTGESGKLHFLAELDFTVMKKAGGYLGLKKLLLP